MNRLVLLVTALMIWGPPRIRLNPRPLGAVFTDPMDMDLTALLQVGVWVAAAAVVAAGLCLRGLDRPPLPRLLRRGPLSVYMVFALVAMLSASYSVQPLYTAYFALKVIVAVAAVAILLGDDLSSGSGRRLLNTFYGVHVFQWSVILACLWVDPSLVGTQIPGVGYRLHAALFGDFGASSVIAGFLFLSRALSQGPTPRRVLWGLLYVSTLVCVFLSRTRSMSLAVILGCWALFGLHRRISIRYASLCLSIVAGATLFLFDWQQRVVDYVMRGQSTAAFVSLTGRAQAFDHLLSVWRDSPVFGYGFAAGSRVFLMSFVYEYGMGIGSAHDALSKVLIELGILGCTLLSACVLYSLLRLVVAWRSVRKDPSLRDLWQHAAALMLFALVSSVVSGGVADISFAFLISVALAEVVAASSVQRRRALSMRTVNSLPAPIAARA